MVECKCCGREMLEADGCSITHLLYQLDDHFAKWFKRIKVGDPGDMMGVEPGERCHNCNALYGHYHHFGCDSETCPKCGRQLITCDCKITDGKEED